jgi:3'(2'), 5'-bisphosphate nucleotidase
MASDDDHLARDLAVVAGHRLVELRARGGTPDELRHAGDQLAHEFGEAGRTDWAVHVALWEQRAGGLTAGAVALPAQNAVLSTVNPPPLPGDPPDKPIRIVVSRSRPASFLPRMAELAGADLVPLGSAGAKVAAVLLGEADGYVHAGGQYEWDSAAPVAVAQAAGFHASRIDGSELSYNQADLLMPDILVCPPALTGLLLDAIRSAQS